MASLVRQIQKQIFVQGDFIVFGFGGFYTVPLGWGLDIAYIHRGDFKGPFAKQRVKDIIRKQLSVLSKDNRLTELFLPNFMHALHQTSYYEWHYEKCRLMFEYCRASMPAFRRYETFRIFLAECMGGSYGMSPIDLEKLIKERISAMAGKVNFDEIIRNQKGYLTRHAEDVMKRIFRQLFGLRDGGALFDEVKAAHQGNFSLNAEDKETSLFNSEKFIHILTNWHKKRMAYVTSDAFLDQQWKILDIATNRDKAIGKARRDTIKGLKQQKPELLMLAHSMQIPIFVATDTNANFFRHFFGGISLYVAKDKDELQEYTVFGLCMYQPYNLGGVIVTHGGREYPRFWHTLTEELTHFSDGPQDRFRQRGAHRYSGDPRFDAAYKKDRASIGPWNTRGVLGAKEWAQALTLKRTNLFTAARIKKRIEAFEATLDFDHYRPDERAAEIFAALPIIERAVGASRARNILPELFAFYDRHYLPQLAKEAAEIRT
ncbi:MAG: hypothetical protein EB060_05165 [Proteobacteria bacterium]|nr:hypothetical protein [Pseudomonadota bacterium]